MDFDGSVDQQKNAHRRPFSGVRCTIAVSMVPRWKTGHGRRRSSVQDRVTTGMRIGQQSKPACMRHMAESVGLQTALTVRKARLHPRLAREGRSGCQSARATNKTRAPDPPSHVIVTGVQPTSPGRWLDFWVPKTLVFLVTAAQFAPLAGALNGSLGGAVRGVSLPLRPVIEWTTAVVAEISSPSCGSATLVWGRGALEPGAGVDSNGTCD